MIENEEPTQCEPTVANDEDAPLELGIQMLETADAPFWATGAGVLVSATIVASVAYT
ncbi:hypothetical protein [Rhizomonospora bruguierae]|uniref:hypothetical protein n=1 Tax=Rhizomonospora bruguierae TaxID=1581705 RepID=UPI001BCEE07B|nr:hypothetical protein [Micromonospora sp. NBRC 107566]